ncbi:MAG: PIN domain-containing protein [Opitutales bacterium]|nr:PIN domain-containing protein [Opitutales bacterium]
MAANVVVDSNVYIRLLRHRIDPVTRLGSWIGTGDLVICGMIRVEVERGLKVERIRKRLGTFFDVMINVPTSNKIWEQTVRLAWHLDRRGKNLPPQDILIAVSALAAGAAVLTDDAHFEAIPDLTVLSPARELDDWPPE